MSLSYPTYRASRPSVERRTNRLERAFARDLERRKLPPPPDANPRIEEADIASLPEPAQRYMRFMGVVGRPRDWAIMGRFEGRFRLAPNDSWRPMTAIQYSTRRDRMRLFYLEVSVFGVPVLGRDTYVCGNGRLQIRPLDAFTVEDDVGPELDSAELVTYLNDAVLLAPSFLLEPDVTFRAVDASAFDVSLQDRGHTVSARVSVDERGAPRQFSTNDRFLRDPYGEQHSFTRCRWTTPIAGWQRAGERMLPSSGTAVWHLPQGDFMYAEIDFQPDRLAFNVSPILR